MAKQLPVFALLLWVLPALLHASSPRDPQPFLFWKKPWRPDRGDRNCPRSRQTGDDRRQ